MKVSISFIAEYYNTETGKVIESKVLREDNVKKPTTIEDLGYLQEEQISILQLIQDFKLHYETCLLNDTTDCPNCGKKTTTHGVRKSNFHAALTDHKVKIQRRSCSCSCGWSSPYTLEAIYGSSLHPDLIEKQAIQGAENSYRQASRQLNAESKNKRSINNDDRIRKNVGMIGTLIEAQNLDKIRTILVKEAAKELTAFIDGGHLKSNNINSRSFEAIIATVRRPESISRI